MYSELEEGQDMTGRNAKRILGVFFFFDLTMASIFIKEGVYTREPCAIDSTDGLANCILG